MKPDGDNVEYIPFAIYVSNLMVGFIMHAVVRETSNMYWINGFIIDQKAARQMVAENQHYKKAFI